MKYIATISGGKDSVTMCDLLLKNGYPVDEIIFADTLEEFNEMYIYIERLKDYFKTRYGKEITVLKPKSTFEDWAYGTMKKGERVGSVRGLPSLANGMCYWRREAKVKPTEEHLKRKYQDEEVTQYIGYTLGENRTVANYDNFTFEFPLKDIFKMTEEDCKKYLVDQEMENPLYRHFSRTGCSMCPFQSDRSWYEVYSNYPEVWEKMKVRESHLQKLEDEGAKVINKYWFMGNKTTEDMELEFNMKSKSLFDFSDEPLKDCFCKI